MAKSEKGVKSLEFILVDNIYFSRTGSGKYLLFYREGFAEFFGMTVDNCPDRINVLLKHGPFFGEGFLLELADTGTIGDSHLDGDPIYLGMSTRNRLWTLMNAQSFYVAVNSGPARLIKKHR